MHHHVNSFNRCFWKRETWRRGPAIKQRHDIEIKLHSTSCSRQMSLEGVGTKTLRSTLKTTIRTTKPCSFCERSVDRCVPHNRSAIGVWRPARKQNERSEAARQGTKFENETKGGNPTAFRCDPLHYWTNDLPTGWPPEISTARFQDRRGGFSLRHESLHSQQSWTMPPRYIKSAYYKNQASHCSSYRARLIIRLRGELPATWSGLNAD